jgi:sulfite exporter TauE/SafE
MEPSDVKNMFEREEDRLKDLFHINKYEHLNVFRYLVSVFIYALVGIIVGSVLNSGLQELQGNRNRNNRLRCVMFGSINIIIIILLFWLLNIRTFIRKGLYFDDWIWNTMAGFLCITLFFETQTLLASNMACAVRYDS